MPPRQPVLIICFFLLAATFAIYWPVQNHEFVNYDDDEYVTENRYVKAGLSREGFIWAFKTPVAGLWHPLTLISHMLDCHLHGLNPGRHHITSLFIHAANTLLLFLVLKRMTGALWRSAAVAALFAFHPLQVESVAWVAERKNVLSTFFWMLTLWGYCLYVKSPGLKLYLLPLVFLAVGLMAKPMLVTLPFVMLLLDYWPFSRTQSEYLRGPDHTETNNSGKLGSQKSPLLGLIWEKLPFLSLSAGSILLTLWAQGRAGALASLEFIPLKVRIANALISYVSYMGKMIWPFHLAVFYPHPGMPPAWKVAGATLMLSAIFLITIRSWRRHPYLMVGWLWFLGTLIPVIGMVQVGSQAVADRYAYVPLIGLFIMISWGVPTFLSRWRHRRIFVAAPAGLVLFFMTITWCQIRHWKTSATLFEHALRATSNNHRAHYNLGVALHERGNLNEAVAHYRAALIIRPNYVEAHNNLGAGLAEQGKTREATAHFYQALKISPDHAKAQNNLGIVLVGRGKVEEAISHYTEALRIQPDYPEAHNNLGVALAQQGKLPEAIASFSQALHFKADYTPAQNNLRRALKQVGKSETALEHSITK
jgi:Flp pilus assembly protein TadD